MWISPAYAQGLGGFDLGGIGSFLPIILIFVIFWFLLIRPQQKKAKEHREMLGRIRRGDRIVTNGGLIGTVTKVNDGELAVEIAEGVKVAVARPMVADVFTKGQSGGTVTVAGGGDSKPQGLMGMLLGGGKK